MACRTYCDAKSAIADAAPALGPPPAASSDHGAVQPAMRQEMGSDPPMVKSVRALRPMPTPARGRTVEPRGYTEMQDARAHWGQRPEAQPEEKTAEWAGTDRRRRAAQPAEKKAEQAEATKAEQAEQADGDEAAQWEEKKAELAEAEWAEWAEARRQRRAAQLEEKKIELAEGSAAIPENALGTLDQAESSLGRNPACELDDEDAMAVGIADLHYLCDLCDRSRRAPQAEEQKAERTETKRRRCAARPEEQKARRAGGAEGPAQPK